MFWVVGGVYVIGLVVVIFLGVFVVNYCGSWIDYLIMLIMLVGYFMLFFFIGVLVIVVFVVNLGWLLFVYDIMYVVIDLGLLWV